MPLSLDHEEQRPLASSPSSSARGRSRGQGLWRDASMDCHRATEPQHHLQLGKLLEPQFLSQPLLTCPSHSQHHQTITYS
ncbi:hypothetical protein CRENBAI_011511 [Crenichthys baileyi]|uniref:Uncharacterized protein n=1 Tax=Crenichthys baileyi TaxID=28760 RepID=A0AAV9SL29_9TELE